MDTEAAFAAVANSSALRVACFEDFFLWLLLLLLLVVVVVVVVLEEPAALLMSPPFDLLLLVEDEDEFNPKTLALDLACFMLNGLNAGLEEADCCC